jgi:hypothetical protein
MCVAAAVMYGGWEEDGLGQPPYSNSQVTLRAAAGE